MSPIPGFWEGGPHDPIPVEWSWREFVRSAGGEVVEDLLPKPRTFENADFLFRAFPMVVELKEVETEFGRSSAVRDGFQALIGRLMQEEPNWHPTLLGGAGDYPKWFVSEFVRLFRPPISRILKKANRQIRGTKAHFAISEPTGMLVFVNDGFTQLEPHFVRALASDLLANSYSSIDCFLYMTVNRYVEVGGSNVPRLVWAPLYSERATDSLVELVDDLGRKWFEYLETKIGPFSTPREEVPQGKGSAGTILSRSIVLPQENR